MLVTSSSTIWRAISFYFYISGLVSYTEIESLINSKGFVRRKPLCLLLTHSQSSFSGSVSNETEDISKSIGRRYVLAATIPTFSTQFVVTELLSPVLASADELQQSVYVRAKRPTAYRVDSTIPPTLLPFKSAGREKQVLEALGRGSGTEKDAIVIDTVNLNNILNKIVFGSIATFSSVTSNRTDERHSGQGYASFVCLGLPYNTTSVDIELASSIMETILQPRTKMKMKTSTALGLAFCPYSTQSALDSYIQGTEDDKLINILSKSGVSRDSISLYMPLLRLAKANRISLLALSPEREDVEVARRQGLQEVRPDRRSAYVADPAGFIAMPKDPKYQLYTDRSLFKDFVQNDERDSGGNFFAERILVHEAAATAVATYASNRPEALVALVAPTRDLRFMGGMNGRIPRVCKALNPESKVTNDAVTTILLNPTAKETLSRTRYLRLEIGTGPDTIQYQTKVADYLWFSSIPPVNLIPRLMEG